MVDIAERRGITRRRLLQGSGVAALAALAARVVGTDGGGTTGRTVGGAAFPGSQPTSTAGGATASSGGLVTRHGALLRGLEQSNDNRYREGRFGLMFKDTEPFRPPDALLEEMAARMVDATTGAAPELDNPDVPAGFTFLGQFLDHDITLDTTPLSQQEGDAQVNRPGFSGGSFGWISADGAPAADSPGA